MKNTICFTGHRPSAFPFKFSTKNLEYRKLKKSIQDCVFTLIEKGFGTFICGMALGADTLCAKVVLEFKKQYDIKLLCYLPCKNQERFWSAYDKNTYYDILKQADEIKYCYDGFYCTGCNHLRNKMMVDDSSLVVAIYLGIAGGTQDTIRYASDCGKDIIYIK